MAYLACLAVGWPVEPTIESSSALKLLARATVARWRAAKARGTTAVRGTAGGTGRRRMDLASGAGNFPMAAEFPPATEPLLLARPVNLEVVVGCNCRYSEQRDFQDGLRTAPPLQTLALPSRVEAHVGSEHFGEPPTVPRPQREKTCPAVVANSWPLVMALWRQHPVEMSLETVPWRRHPAEMSLVMAPWR